MAELAMERDLFDFSPDGLEETIDESCNYLIFVCDDLKMGVEADCVVEILNDVTSTYLPMVPPHVQGIINLRGEIIPILDIRNLLGKESVEKSLVIVLNLDDVRIGILADKVDRMMDIPLRTILPMPAQQAQKLVCGICTLPDRSGTMMVLDCNQLMPYEC